MANIQEIISTLRDCQKAHIKLLLQDESDLSLNAIYKEDSPPHFFLLFPPDSLPDSIEISAQHPLVITQDGEAYSFYAVVTRIVDARRLHLKALSTLDPSSLREYFRVNTSVPITARHLTSNTTTGQANWSITGHTQDISGSGVLALFDQEPLHRSEIILDLSLNDKNISLIGHIIRKKMLRSKRWQVSFHFDNISSKARDTLLSFLLAEQRLQLRQNVTVRD